mgnify:CR=1 FL=1
MSSPSGVRNSCAIGLADRSKVLVRAGIALISKSIVGHFFHCGVLLYMLFALK